MIETILNEHFFLFWSICCLIVFIFFFVSEYFEYKESEYAEYTVAELAWGSFFVLLGPVTVMAIIFVYIGRGICKFFEAKFWHNRALAFRKPIEKKGTDYE